MGYEHHGALTFFSVIIVLLKGWDSKVLLFLDSLDQSSIQNFGHLSLLDDVELVQLIILLQNDVSLVEALCFKNVANTILLGLEQIVKERDILNEVPYLFIGLDDELLADLSEVHPAQPPHVHLFTFYFNSGAPWLVVEQGELPETYSPAKDHLFRFVDFD